MKMRTATITVPKAFLYEENPNISQSNDKTKIADQVLMGWMVGILEIRKDYLRVMTHYGYEGWLPAQAVDFPKNLSGKCQDESRKDELENQNTYVITSRFADVMSIPSVQGIILCTLERGSFVQLLRDDEEKGYCLVQTAFGKQGYVPKIGINKRKDTNMFLTEEREFTDVSMLSSDLNTSEGEEKFRNAVIETAEGYLGTQYRWGGKSPEGIDCSGLAFMSYMLNGVLIYRDASIKDGYPIHEIPREMAKKGDLFFFPGHVAIYLGEGRFIHSTGFKKSFGCVINSFNPEDKDYREDLANSITAAGSIFPLMQ